MPGPETFVASVKIFANVAVTLVFALIANVQTGLALPEHAPDQPVNCALAFGTAVSAMDVPEAKLAPGGVCCMVPGPTTFVARETCGPLNVAVTVVFAFSVMTHSVAGVPEAQGLDDVQLRNCAPAFGTAVRITCEPDAKEVPVGDCVMVPGPTTLVANVTFGTKFPVAIVFAFNTKVQV